MKNVVKSRFFTELFTPNISLRIRRDENGNKLSDKLFLLPKAFDEFCARVHALNPSHRRPPSNRARNIDRLREERSGNNNKKNLISHSPLKCFGQQTNSTPENNEMPHGSSIAKLRICILRSWHAVAPVWFHRTNGQQRDALWMWSNKQPSGTSKASDWKGPSVSE